MKYLVGFEKIRLLCGAAIRNRLKNLQSTIFHPLCISIEGYCAYEQEKIDVSGAVHDDRLRSNVVLGGVIIGLVVVIR